MNDAIESLGKSITGIVGGALTLNYPDMARNIVYTVRDSLDILSTLITGH